MGVSFREKWEGPVAGPGDAVEFLGVDEVNECQLKHGGQT